MDDLAYYRIRVQQSLDMAARAAEPARSIHMDLARRYTESWQRECDGGTGDPAGTLMPRPPRRP